MQYDSLHPNRADSTQEVNKVKHVTSIRRGNATSLQELQSDAEDLTSELQQVQVELHKVQCQIHSIVNESHNMVRTWHRKTPVLASVAVGGADKTLHFLGGRNAAGMNRLVQYLAQQQTTEGEHIRGF